MNTKKIKKEIFFSFLTSIFIFIILCSYYYISIRNTLKKEIPQLLDYSIQIKINKLAQNTYFSFSDFYHNPKKFGQIENITAIYADTTFTYQREISNHEVMVFAALQNFLLENGELTPNIIQSTFDSLCNDKNINIESVVGIFKRIYPKINLLSNDTINFKSDYQFKIVNQGEMKDIDYIIYTKFSFFTYWKLIPQKLFIIIIIFITIIGFIYLYLNYRIWNQRKYTISKINKEIYRIGNIIFDVKRNELKGDFGIKNISGQTHTLLVLFLENKNYRIEKETIKMKFWPKSTNPTNNMTSLVNKLKDILKECDCNYSISTDKNNEKTYILDKLLINNKSCK